MLNGTQQKELDSVFTSDHGHLSLIDEPPPGKSYNSAQLGAILIALQDLHARCDDSNNPPALPEQTVDMLQQMDAYSTYEHILRILQHPAPQNYTGNIAAGRVQPERVSYRDYRNRVVTEQRGILNLSRRNDRTAVNVTKPDVVRRIAEYLKYKIKQVLQDVRQLELEESTYRVMEDLLFSRDKAMRFGVLPGDEPEAERKIILEERSDIRYDALTPVGVSFDEFYAAIRPAFNSAVNRELLREDVRAVFQDNENPLIDTALRTPEWQALEEAYTQQQAAASSALETIKKATPTADTTSPDTAVTWFTAQLTGVEVGLTPQQQRAYRVHLNQAREVQARLKSAQEALKTFYTGIDINHVYIQGLQQHSRLTLPLLRLWAGQKQGELHLWTTHPEISKQLIYTEKITVVEPKQVFHLLCQAGMQSFRALAKPRRSDAWYAASMGAALGESSFTAQHLRNWKIDPNRQRAVYTPDSDIETRAKLRCIALQAAIAGDTESIFAIVGPALMQAKQSAIKTARTAYIRKVQLRALRGAQAQFLQAQIQCLRIYCTEINQANQLPRADILNQRLRQTQKKFIQSRVEQYQQYVRREYLGWERRHPDDITQLDKSWFVDRKGQLWKIQSTHHDIVVQGYEELLTGMVQNHRQILGVGEQSVALLQEKIDHLNSNVSMLQENATGMTATIGSTLSALRSLNKEYEILRGEYHSALQTLWESRPQHTGAIEDENIRRPLEIRHARWVAYLPNYMRGSMENLRLILKKAAIPIGVTDSSENTMLHLALSHFRLQAARFIQFYAPGLWDEKNAQNKTALAKSGLKMESALVIAVRQFLYEWSPDNRQYQAVTLPESTLRVVYKKHLCRYEESYRNRYSWFKLPQRAEEVKKYREALLALKGAWSDEPLLPMIDRLSAHSGVVRGWLGRSSLHDTMMRYRRTVNLNPEEMHTLNPRHLPLSDKTHSICYHTACEQEAARLRQQAADLTAEVATLKSNQAQLVQQAAQFEQALAQNGQINYGVLFAGGARPQQAAVDGEQVAEMGNVR